MRSINSKRQAGFSLIELAITVVVILILAGIAVPPMFNYVHIARLRGAATDYASLLQTGRMRSVQDDRFYSTYLLTGSQVRGYVDLTSNGGTGAVGNDPLIAIHPEVAPTAVGAAPDTANLKGQFLPAGSTLVPKDGTTTGTPVIFGPRGLPCTSQSATGGSVCVSSGGATAFWVFFNDTLSGAWEAVTVTPAGRIQRWQHGGSGWSKL
jgi:prepilin-type N-terminal cleavage/methylation domain-containing protein